MEEWEELESELEYMKELVTQLSLERGNFAEDFKGESSTWDDKVQQLLEQISLLSEENEQEGRQVFQLETNLVEIRRQLAELLPPQPSAGSSQAELQLQAEAHQLQKELQNMEEQLYIQMQENQILSLQNLEQQEQLWFLDQQAGEQHDQNLAHLQNLRATCEQHRVSNQQLTSEKEKLQQHLLRQTQLLEQLEQEQVQSRLEEQMANQKLQDTLKCIEATRHQNKQLRTQLSFLAFPQESEGVGKGEEDEEVTPSDVTVPEDIDNPQTMWEFYLEALSVAELKKMKLSQQLQEHQARCRCLANLAAQFQTKLGLQAISPKTWNHGVSTERKQDEQAPKKLRIFFTQNLPGKVDYQKLSDDLQHQCSQLSEHVTTLEESIVFYKAQMEVLDELYQEKVNCVRWLTHEKREKKKELQELLFYLTDEGTECQYQIWTATQAPAAEASPDRLGTTIMEGLEEWQDFEEVKLEDNLEPVQGKARVPHKDPTTE
ncbi:PREDICTED: golgin subfamily A member 2-like [Dipodomys ordii]|uniref:Golgin subfamily A member 2-like n=1 Tax=Dipodomys ordii TaxID=10020 RepID=A0A1S3G1B0_DIPOR|nr:PREDICTED: golgin subfamily A member 2-like [Dipodomys ordii]